MALALTSSPAGTGLSPPGHAAPAQSPPIHSLADSRAITVLLGQRYGDGLVYLHGHRDRVLLSRAIDHGLVNEEGYLTPAGYRFWVGRADA